MKPGKQPGQKATKTRQPIKHSKTFSGCWTCRSRHVKCDETRPDCVRCSKGGFQCGGYGIKLVWVDGDTQGREQNIRRAIGAPAVYDDESPFKRLDVDEALGDIERVSTESKSLSAGPFSVFSLAGALDFEHQPKDSGSRSAPSPDASLDVVWAAEEGGHEVIETVISPSISTASRVTCHDDNNNSCWSATTVSASRSRAWSSSSSSLGPQTWSCPLLSTRHLDLLPRPAEQRALIHHWTNFVCWHLVPVDRPDNLFRSVFTPMALAGLTSSSSQSTGEVALFHALCATSAYSRGQLLNDETNSFTLAMKHYNLAIMHLRHSLASLKEHPSGHGVDVQRGAILATITMFSAMDMITGRSSEWRTHLQGGASWLSTIDEATWNQDKSSSMVYQGYLAIAALCNVDLPLTIDIESENCLGDTKNYVLDRFFGLTRPILKHIMLMNSLIKRISTTTSAMPSSEVLDELEHQLYDQSPESLDLSAQDLPPLAQQLTLHHAYVFYYASLIYFHRTIRRHAPTSIQVQTIVSSAVQCLEDIEALGGDSIGCTLVWPPFIVACECVGEEMQERILRWYMCKRRHGFMNLEMSKDIAKEVWRRRDMLGASVDIQWQDVLKEMKMDIVLA